MEESPSSIYFEISGAPPGAREFSISEVLATKPVFIIGSDARAHLRILDPKVAPAHAIVEHYADAYLILPRFPQLEVFVNNARVRGARVLNPGDSVRIGATEMRFRQAEAASRIDAPTAEGLLLLEAPVEQ